MKLPCVVIIPTHGNKSTDPERKTDFYNVTNASAVSSSLHRECNPVSLVQFHQISTASRPNSNSTLSSTTLKSEGESPSKFSLKLGSKNQLDQLSGLRISYLTTTISRLQRRL